jgi:hypothetical protein
MFDLLIFGIDCLLSPQSLDPCTTPEDWLLYVLGSRLRGQIHPENMSEHSDLLGFPLPRSTFGRMTEVYDESLSRRSDAEVRKSNIAVKDIRPMNRF